MTEHRSVVDWRLGRGSGGAVGIITKGHEEEHDRSVTYFDCGDSFTHFKTYRIVYFKYVRGIVCQSYLQKTLKKPV